MTLIAEMLEYARQADMPLAIEPLHPAYAADRACVNTTKQALDICDRLDPARSGALGVALDVYHIWWDPELMPQIARAGKDRLLAFHVCDWLVPTKDILNDRGMMGDGVIDIRSVRAAVEAQGFCRLFGDRDFFQRLVGQADGRGAADLHRAAPDGGVSFVGWAKRSVPTKAFQRTLRKDVVGTAQARLCPPYDSTAHGTLKNPRNRTRPPRTGAPFSS